MSILLIVLIGALVLALVVLAVLLLIGRDSETQPDEMPITASSDMATNLAAFAVLGWKGCLPFIFVLLFTGGGLATLYFGYQSYQNSKASETWPVVWGTIVTSEVSDYDSDGTTMYEARVVYEYTVNDSKIMSDKVSFGEVNTSNYRPAREIVDRYPEGQQVKVYYNPENPDKAVLEPGVKSGVWLPLGIGGAFTLVGLGMGMAFGLAILTGRWR